MPTVREFASWTLELDGNPPVPVEMQWTAPEVQWVRSDTAVLPDLRWEHVDTAGHGHLWVTDAVDRRSLKQADIPTLTRSSRHVDCDGSCREEGCEGYDVPVWHCRECGEEVQPGYVPDSEARTVGIPVQVGPASFLAVASAPPVPAWGADPPVGGYPVVLRRVGGGYPEGLVRGRGWLGNATRASWGDSFEVHVNPDLPL